MHFRRQNAVAHVDVHPEYYFHLQTRQFQPFQYSDLSLIQVLL